MKRCLVFAVAAVSALGCGGSAFTNGNYSGNLTMNLSCSDGSGGTRSSQDSWTLSQSGSTITLTSSGSCSPITGNVSGDTATLVQKTCGTQNLSSGQGTETVSLTGGTISANGNSLNVAMNMAATLNFSNGSSATCTGPLTGTMTKQ